MIKMWIVIFAIIVWILCAVITYGVMKYKDDTNEMEGDEVLWMGVCIATWPIFLIMGIGSLIGSFLLKKLSNLGEFVGGFLYGAFKKKED